MVGFWFCNWGLYCMFLIMGNWDVQKWANDGNEKKEREREKDLSMQIEEMIWFDVKPVKLGLCSQNPSMMCQTPMASISHTPPPSITFPDWMDDGWWMMDDGWMDAMAGWGHSCFQLTNFLTLFKATTN